MIGLTMRLSDGQLFAQGREELDFARARMAGSDQVDVR